MGEIVTNLVRIYKKRKRINVLKQQIKKLLYTALLFIGCGACLNWGIDYLCTVDWFVPKTIEMNLNKEAEAEDRASDEVALTRDVVVDSQDETAAVENSIPSEIKQDGIEGMITRYFKDDAKIAKAVFQSESGLRTDAQNWNCRYGGVSQSCKFEDREKAWSVDCGIAQINTPGNTCPQELFVPENNLKLAYKLYKNRGFSPWVNFKNERYLSYL